MNKKGLRLADDIYEYIKGEVIAFFCEVTNKVHKASRNLLRYHID